MEKIGRTKIVDLLKRTDIGAMVNVKGWVRTRRGSKQEELLNLLPHKWKLKHPECVLTRQPQAKRQNK